MNDLKNNQKPLAIFLLFMLFFMWVQTVWTPYFLGDRRPNAPAAGTTPELPAAPGAPAQTAEAPPSNYSPQAPAAPAPTRATGHFPTDKELEDGGKVVVNTNLFQITLSLLGGRVSRALLNEYKETIQPNSPNLNLITHEESFPLPLGIHSGDIDDAWVKYQLVSPSGKTGAEGTFNLEIPSTENETITLRGTLSDGRVIEKTLAFAGNSYLIDFQTSIRGAANRAYRIEVEWTKLIKKDSPTLLDPYNIGGYVWFDGQKAHREPFSKFKTERQELGNVLWVSEADKYFMATLLSMDRPVSAHLLLQDQVFSLRLTGEDTSANFKLFIGPMNYEVLQKIGFELQRNVDFGWAAFVSAPLLFLLQFLYKFFGNYGVAIVALTIVVRGALFPLNSAAFKQMKAMQKIQPEMKEIRERIKDRQEQQMAMMSLYKKHGVNPFGGCFPMVFQIPIFIGLYYALLVSIDLRHAPFAFWISDLSAPEKLMIGGVAIPVMVILWVVSMLIQQWMMPTTDEVQKKVMMFMPIAMGFMLRLCPAGVTLYWLTSNLISIGQQRSLNIKGVRTSAQVTAFVSAGLLAIAFVLTKLG